MGYLRILILISAIIGVNYCSEAQPESLYHSSFAKRHAYVFQLEREITNIENPQTALDSLQTIIDKVNRANDKAFAYQLGFIRIFIPAFMARQNAIQELTKQIEKGKALGYEYETIEAQNKLAKYYWGIDNKTMAMELGLSTYKVYHKFSIEEFPVRFQTQSTLANWYYSFNDFSKSKDLILELMAIKSFENSRFYESSLVLIGLCYRQLGELDSSLFYFKHAYLINNENSTAGNKALAAGNIGSVFFFRKDLDSAIHWVKSELEIWRIENNNSTFASYSAYLALSEIYLKKEDIKSAQSYLDSAANLKSSVRRNFININRYYKIKCRLLEVSGNLKGALIYKDSILMISDSIDRVKSTAQIVSAEKRIADAEHKNELLYLETLKKSSLWIRNFVIIAILFLAVIVVLLINRSRLKLKQQELFAINEKNKAENKLLLFTKEFQAKNSQIDELNEELSLLSNEKDLRDKNEAILRLQQSTILTDEQWDEFRLLFEQVYSGFIGKLKNKFQGLTPAELRYLTLLKLQLSNKEMANILGVSMNTVHNYKSRMRRKYELSEDLNFEDLIQDI